MPDESGADRPGAGEITRLLHDVASGRPGTEDDLYRQVRRGLRRIARHRLGREGADPMLQTTLLADDAFLEIVGSREMRVVNRRHLFALAARLMERSLRMHARTRNRLKRNGGVAPLALGEHDSELRSTESPLGDAVAGEMHEVIAECLDRLAEQYGETTRDVVLLRRGCGESVQSTARLLGLSDRTIKRRTRYGLAWLVRELQQRGYEIGDVEP